MPLTCSKVLKQAEAAYTARSISLPKCLWPVQRFWNIIASLAHASAKVPKCLWPVQRFWNSASAQQPSLFGRHLNAFDLFKGFETCRKIEVPSISSTNLNAFDLFKGFETKNMIHHG